MFRLCLLVLLGVWHASGQGVTLPVAGTKADCTDEGIQNCGACEVAGMDCGYCAMNAVMKEDYSGCLSCDNNCIDCELDSTGTKAVCKQCIPGYIVKSDGSSCVSCGTWCLACSFADSTQTTVSCSVCAPTAGIILGAYSKQCQNCGTITGCSACTESSSRALVCSSCMTGYYFTSSSATCTSCLSNCATCTSGTKCSLCNSGYILETSDPTNCLPCPSGCTKCTGVESTITTGVSGCSACANGYYLSGDVCASCMSQCATCVDGSTCSTCLATGWYFDSSDKSCTACSYGCDTCTFDSSDVETCSKCSTNFGFQNDDSSSCTLCSTNCLTCSSADECTSCVASPYMVPVYMAVGSFYGTFCALCPANCAVCTDGGDGAASCTTCISGYIAGYNAQGVSLCLKCPSNCDLVGNGCSFDSTKYAATCKTCMTDSNGLDYYAVNGACKSCFPQCAACLTATTCDGTAAQPCIAGYFWDTSPTTPKCTACSSHCDVCTTSLFAGCTNCAAGYYKGASSCVACITGCTCTSATTCTGCFASGVLPSTTQTDGCVKCADSNCDIYKCADPTQSSPDCDKFVVDDSALGALVSNCLGGTCTQCLLGYLLDSNDNCKACDAHCDLTTPTNCAIDVADVISCAACVSGYYVTASGTCSQCSDVNCADCEPTPGTTCVTCKTGYVEFNGGCKKVPNMCDSTFTTYDGKLYDCSACTDSNWVATDANVCAPGPSNCLIAELNSADTTGLTVVCQTCKSGYGLNAKFGCDPCPFNCVDCSLDATSTFQVCSSCATNAIENDNLCSQCPRGCTTCSNINGQMTCSACNPNGWAPTPNNGMCVACVGCSQCSQSSGQYMCLPGTCFDGTGLDSDGTCTACDALSKVSLCSNCTDISASGVSNCLDCSSSTVLDPWGTSCVDTSALSNCLMPEYRGYQCDVDSCNSPFTWIPEGPAKGHCGLSCAICGNIDAGIFLPASECQNSAGNYTEDYVPDACWVAMTTDSSGNQLFARGYTREFNCTFAHQFEFYDPDDSTRTLACCISGDGCNNLLMLDGTAGATAATFSLALLFACIVVALRV